MLETSITVRFVSLLYNELRGSRFFGLLDTITLFLAYAYRESFLRKLILGVGNLENYTKESLFYRFVDKVAGFFVGIVKKICILLRNANETSLNKKVFVKLTDGSFVCSINNFFPLCIMAIFLVPHEIWNNMYALLLALLLCVLYAFNLVRNKGFGENIYSVPFQLIAFLFSLLVAVAISFDKGDSIRIFVFFATSYLLCFLVYGAVRDKDSLSDFCRIIYFTLLIASAYGLAQRVLGVEADASFTDLTLNKGMPGRVPGPLGNPNNYAEYIVAFLPFAFAYSLTRKSVDSKALHLVGLCLPAAALLTTYSRSSWIALAAACVLFVVIYNYKTIPYFAAGVICAIPFIPQSVYNRILTIGNTSDSSSAYRITIWTGVFDMLEEYWFTGVGLGPEAFSRVFSSYAIGDTVVARHSHMQFLEMMVEGGVLMFAAYLWLLISVVKRTGALSVRLKASEGSLYAAAAAASVAGVALIGMFEYCFFYPRIMFAFFVCVGLSLSVIKVYGKEGK